MEKLQGGCHCGAVRFEVETEKPLAELKIHACNCSICNKTGFLHLIVPKTQFRLLTNEEDITTYTFNTGVAKHTFCKHCGIKSFYTPRSNPDGYSVNVRCIDDVELDKLKLIPFDGQNWEANAKDLEHLSK